MSEKSGDDKGKKNLSAVLVVLLVVACGLAVANVAVFMNVQEMDNEISSHETHDDTKEDTPENTSEEIPDSFSDKTLEERLSILDQRIEEASSESEIAFLYGAKASTAHEDVRNGDSSKMEIALEYAYKAEELSPDANTAYRLYVYEDEAGHTEAAEKYRLLAEERGYNFDLKGRG